MGPIRPNRYPDASHKVDAPVSDWAKGSIARLTRKALPMPIAG